MGEIEARDQEITRLDGEIEALRQELKEAQSNTRVLQCDLDDYPDKVTRIIERVAPLAGISKPKLKSLLAWVVRDLRYGQD